MKESPIRSAFEKIGGLQVVGGACGVSYQSVQKWCLKGLPRSEFSGETAYAKKIEDFSGGKVKASELLRESREIKTKSK